MKSYLKILTKTLYQKVQRVVEDEYIQPISQSQVYTIINRKSRRGSFNHIKGDKNKSFNYNQQRQDKLSIMENIQRLGLVSPQRQFMLVGDSYSVQVINYRLKELKTKIQAVKDHMLLNYQPNLESIETALNHLEDAKIIQQTKHKTKLMRQKLQRLEQTVVRTKKITQLNIRVKNIKETLKILQKVPNLKKMSLFQLKSINLKQISNFKQSINTQTSTKSPKFLQCIDHIEQFIDKASSEHLRVVINSINELLVIKFDQGVYCKVLRDFIIAKSNIQYQKLLVRLIETQVRDNVNVNGSDGSNKRDSNGYMNSNSNGNNTDSSDGYNNNSSNKNYNSSTDLSHYANIVHSMSQKYISLLINLSKLLRFHRLNNCSTDNPQLNPLFTHSNRPRNLSNISNSSQPQITNNHSHLTNLQSQQSIHINTQQLKSHTCALMDQSLKQQVQQILFNSNLLNQQIFQTLIIIDNFFQIAFSFTTYIFSETINTIKQILMRKSYKMHQQGVNQLTQQLFNQDQNQWNRLPVGDNYRYKHLQKTIQKFNRLHLIQKVPHLYSTNFKFLNINNYNKQQQQQNSQSFQLSIAQNKQQTFQLNDIEFPYDKLQKILSIETVSDSQLPQHDDPVVVICKSSITILKYFQKFMQMYCYFPIQQIRQDILNKMAFYIDFYIYFLFQTFLSEMYKKFFQDNHQTIQEKYHHARVKFLYKEVYQFIKSFKEKQNVKNLAQNNNDSSQTNRRRRDSFQISKYKTKGFSFIRSQIPESNVSQQNCVKARAIATDSIKYLLAYFSHILNHLEKYTEPQKKLDNKETNKRSNLEKYTQKLSHYKILQQQLSDLLLTDIVPLSTRIDFVVPIMKKIKWQQLQNSKQISQYGSMMLKNIRQVYQRLKSMSKGSMPYYIVDRIFSFYWKTQLTFITKIFLQEHIGQKQKGGKVSKLAFQKLVDVLYEGVMEIVDGNNNKGRSIIRQQSLNQANLNINSSNNKSSSNYPWVRLQMFKASYLKIKGIFSILLQNDWQICKQMIQQLFTKYEFIYKITFSIMRAGECSSGLSNNEIEQRQKEIEQVLMEGLG